MLHILRSRIVTASAGFVFALTGCGGGSYTPPPINLSVSVNNTTVTVPPNGMPVNVPVTIVAPTETATFTIAGLPAGVSESYKESESNPSGLLTLIANRLDSARHLYAHDHRWLVRSNCIGDFHAGHQRPAQARQRECFAYRQAECGDSVNAIVGLPPDFLCSLVAPAHIMRLSLRESRIRGRIDCSVQEIRVAPSFSAQVRLGEPGAPVLFLLDLVTTQTPSGPAPIHAES